jgi:hypothetical protein
VPLVVYAGEPGPTTKTNPGALVNAIGSGVGVGDVLAVGAGVATMSVMYS